MKNEQIFRNETPQPVPTPQGERLTATATGGG
jgi:hypothetical protein